MGVEDIRVMAVTEFGKPQIFKVTLKNVRKHLILRIR